MTEEARKSTENGEDKRASLGGKTKIKYSDNILPMARIKKIMKMDPNITDGINIEANYVVCTATELFVRWLSKEVYELDTKALSYKNLAKFVQQHEKLDFLHQIVPHKITVREYKRKFAEVIEKEKKLQDESGSDISESSEESGEEEEEASAEEEESVQEISDSDDETANKSK